MVPLSLSTSPFSTLLPFSGYLLNIQKVWHRWLWRPMVRLLHTCFLMTRFAPLHLSLSLSPLALPSLPPLSPFYLFYFIFLLTLFFYSLHRLMWRLTQWYSHRSPSTFGSPSATLQLPNTKNRTQFLFLNSNEHQCKICCITIFHIKLLDQTKQGWRERGRVVNLKN